MSDYSVTDEYRQRLFAPPGTNGRLSEDEMNRVFTDAWFKQTEENHRERGRYLSAQVLRELLDHAHRAGHDVRGMRPVLEAAAARRTDEQARDLLAAMELHRVRGDQAKLTAREFVRVPQAPAVIDSVLAAEVNLLGGPKSAGKSLLARDLALAVASGQPWRGHPVTNPRYVLWVASEGLHDFAERWQSQPLWEATADAIFVLDGPVNLVTGGDVDWLLDRYADEKPGLVVFDVVYGMGMADDTGTRDVLPVLTAMKKISQVWGAATLALGHPGHNGERRLRGSSMWSQLAYVEWHLADELLTCEKSKLARAEVLGGRCVPEYPELRWLDPVEAMWDDSRKRQAVLEDVGQHPESSQRERARRVAKVLGVSEPTARRYVRQWENSG